MSRHEGIRRRAGLLLPLAVGLIAAATLLLGVLQFRSVSRVSEAEGARLRHSLRTSGGRALEATSEELRVLQALLFLSTEETAAEDWRRFAAAVAFWKANSRFPGLLRDVYLVAPLGPAARFRRWDPAGEGFRQVGEPQALQGLTGAAQAGDPRALAVELLQRGVLLSPLVGSGPEEPASLLALAIDLQVVWRQVLPYYMQQHLEGYPFRLIDVASGAVLTGSPAEGLQRRSPDLSVGLLGPPLFWNRAPSREGTDEAEEEQPPNILQQYLRQDPEVRFWLQRSTGAMAPELRRLLDDQQPKEAPLRLEVFYPGASIQALVSARRAVDLAASGAVLLLLLASTGLLLRLYARTTRLRAMEQEFVASMSHELRTPLAVLQSTSDNLKAGLVTDPDRLARYSDVMHRETRRLAGMVEAVLLYSGIEQRQPRSFTRVPVDLDGLLADVTSALEQPAREAGCSIQVQSAGQLGVVRSDPLALRLIMENLLVNAIRHAGPGEIRLCAAADHHGEGLTLRIAVEDEGPGIPLREQRRVFEPFVRGEGSARAQHPGSGLGLHLVRRVARLLGGGVRLKSPYRDAAGVEHRGCRFTVELPAAGAGVESESGA